MVSRPGGGQIGATLVLLCYVVAMWQMDYTCCIILLINNFPKITLGRGSAYGDQIYKQSYVSRYTYAWQKQSLVDEV